MASEYDSLSREVSANLNKIFADFTQSARKAESERAKANPLAYKNSRVMEDGAGYRYYVAGLNGRGSKVRFCYTTKRNVAGYFLLWREVETAKHVKRDQWDATTSKSSAIRSCRDAMKQFRAEQQK